MSAGPVLQVAESPEIEPGHKATRLASDRERPDVALRRRDHQGIVYLGCFFGQTTTQRGGGSLCSLAAFPSIMGVSTLKCVFVQENARQ